ncbi:hypothetical protein X739_05955 [Mesorhizobium sp. LNHC220B00]|nr:hypothetical protein [Mesorhizobium sp. LNHC220B00]ESY88046.1 hypothetical protein X739_05955 [Mesorhizobium sp. LNHC220B00]
MAKNSLVLGGTPGAQPQSAVANFLSIQFDFSDEQKQRLLALCPPSEQFMEYYRHGLAECVATPEIAIVEALRGCGRRFLRNKIQPISKADQKKYLESIEEHTNALIGLFAGVFEFDRTIADPFQFLEQAGKERGDRRMRRDHWSETLGMLTMLNFFAKWQLGRDVKPGAADVKEKTRRKTEYPRMVLIADLLAAYQRITGLAPTAYAQRPDENPEGRRRVSPAVDFISVAVPPIMKAARIKNSEILDDQTIRKEIATIKRLWETGQYPEREYQLRRW